MIERVAKKFVAEDLAEVLNLVWCRLIWYLLLSLFFVGIVVLIGLKHREEKSPPWRLYLLLCASLFVVSLSTGRTFLQSLAVIAIRPLVSSDNAITLLLVMAAASFVLARLLAQASNVAKPNPEPSNSRSPASGPPPPPGTGQPGNGGGSANSHYFFPGWLNTCYPQPVMGGQTGMGPPNNAGSASTQHRVSGAAYANGNLSGGPYAACEPPHPYMTSDPCAAQTQSQSQSQNQSQSQSQSQGQNFVSGSAPHFGSLSGYPQDIAGGSLPGSGSAAEFGQGLETDRYRAGRCDRRSGQENTRVRLRSERGCGFGFGAGESGGSLSAATYIPRGAADDLAHSASPNGMENVYESGNLATTSARGPGSFLQAPMSFLRPSPKARGPEQTPATRVATSASEDMTSALPRNGFLSNLYSRGSTGRRAS